MKNLQRYLICFIIGILLYYLVNTIYKCNIERLNIGGATYVLVDRELQLVDPDDYDIPYVDAMNDITRMITTANNHKEACDKFRGAGIDFSGDIEKEDGGPNAGKEFGYMVLKEKESPDEEDEMIDCNKEEYRDDYFSAEEGEEEATQGEIEGILEFLEILEKADEEYYDTYFFFEDTDLSFIQEDTTSKYSVEDSKKVPAFLEYIDPYGDRIPLDGVFKISSGAYGTVFKYYSKSTKYMEISVAVKEFKLTGRWDTDIDLRNELNIIRYINTKEWLTSAGKSFLVESCNMVNSRVMTLSNKKEIVIMDEMNGTINDFMDLTVDTFEEWRKGGKLEESNVRIIVTNISKYLYCLHNFNPPLSYVDLKPANILYKMVRTDHGKNDIKLYLGDLGSIYIQKRIIIGSDVKWKGQDAIVIDHTYDKKNIRYTIQIPLKGGKYKIQDNIIETELTLTRNYNKSTFPTPEIINQANGYITSEDVMVWGFGALLLVLLGFNYKILQHSHMQKHGKTVGEYYDIIIKKIEELEIQDETLKHIIDEIFRPNRVERSINMEYIKGFLLKEAD